MTHAFASLTVAAWKRVAELMSNAPAGTVGLRLSLVKGGCAGYEYRFDYTEAVQPLDDVIEAPEGNVYIDRAASLYLFGTTIDYKANFLESGFTFDNPNEASSCGCGQSVSFRSAGPPAALSAE